MTRPNPLVDELTPEAKAELAAMFAAAKARIAAFEMRAERPRIRRQWWER
jgi:hypothetical protein